MSFRALNCAVYAEHRLLLSCYTQSIAVAACRRGVLVFTCAIMPQLTMWQVASNTLIGPVYGPRALSHPPRGTPSRDDAIRCISADSRARLAASAGPSNLGVSPRGVASVLPARLLVRRASSRRAARACRAAGEDTSQMRRRMDVSTALPPSGPGCAVSCSWGAMDPTSAAKARALRSAHITASAMAACSSALGL